MRAKMLVATSITAAVLTAGATMATADSNDGVRLTGQFVNGGSVQLELEARNVEPMICFIHDNPAPNDGDGIHTSIRSTATDAEVVDLGGGDQWLNGSAQGCAIPANADAARLVFARPQDYYVRFEVVENQGTAGQAGPFVTQALRPG